MVTDTQIEEVGLAILDQKEEGLKALVAQFTGLKVNGIDDKEGFKKLRDARITLKGERVAIKNHAEDLREPAVKFQKRVIEREKQLIAIIEPLETELHAEEKRIEALKEEARVAREREEAKQLQDRLNALNQYNFGIDWMEVKHMDEDQFNELLAHAKDLHEQDQKRVAELKAQEEERRKAEEDKLRIEREEFARQQEEFRKREAALKAQQEAREQELKRLELEAIERRRKEEERLNAEREKLEAEKRQIADNLFSQRKLTLDTVVGLSFDGEYFHHETFNLRVKSSVIRGLDDAAFQLFVEESKASIAKQIEELKARMDAEQKERERLEKIEAERQEALKPDKQKLKEFADQVIKLSNNTPACATIEASDLAQEISNKLYGISEFITFKVDEL